ncbi:hypothetical protein N7474_003716 [Penicillium riverlandense]|uniref:uncharacterized protein n=1 Tax=Penicillium riverlandense TaxID=1903569 RepID=UPI0025480B18|nr:uncharacterized protein N7474_003716 [Penicillium riverlandense]KAJ5818125.1 hypothetical protein N7474_003716 [Penicillium riverlandense]
METVRQSCRPKHQVLTLKCYPRYQKGVSEVRPNPSELSYLLYYASTRRSKLTKVGAFLEKRVARDVWRRRLGNVQVALQIMTALIEKVPRDLPIYARSVLTVIETVLRSNDITMVEDSIVTFETFCRHQDMAAIAVEQGLVHQYREVVRTYAGFADPSSPTVSRTQMSPPVAIRWRTAGLRAIKGVVGSDGLAADGGTSLRLILPVILENLYSGEENILVNLQIKLRDSEKPEREGLRRRRLSVATVRTVDAAEGDATLAGQSTADADRHAEMDTRLLALRCLEQIIVSGSNRGQIRIAASIILRFISNKNIPRPDDDDDDGEANTPKPGGNWATTLIELIANWCPVQVRFVILVTAMEILHDTTPKEDALESSFTILSVIDWLLKSPVNMIGLSIMDILYGLMHYASDILSPPDRAEEKQDNTSAVFMSPRRKELLALLEQCIGNLATHIYYGDQVADMMRAILRHFKPVSEDQDTNVPSSLATVHESGAASPKDQNNTETSAANNEKLPHAEYFSRAAIKLTALRSVKAILTVANQRALAAAAGVESRNPVGIHVWEGTQGLLRDSDREVRHAYADAFLSWLQLETNNDNLRARVDTPKYIKQPSRRDSDIPDKSSNRRSTSVPGNQREKVALAAQSHFLRLLHLAIYDSALEGAADLSEILFLHLLLATLVENLGVNAVQFGLPMVLKLQDDLFTSADLKTTAARVNIGSLVHGYLSALSEKFNLESSAVGAEIRTEIEERERKGQWFSKIKLPASGLEAITMNDEKITVGDDTEPPVLTPFRNVEGLVEQIDKSYRQSSPQTSPKRGFSFPVLNHTISQPPSEGSLPSPVKEQMLSSWSREAVLAAAEKDSVKTLSVSGSRGGTMTARNNGQANGVTNGSPAGSMSQKNRPMSVPEGTSSPLYSSSRGSPVRFNELRRVLSISNEPSSRSPLRRRLDTSNSSIISSGSESMVSGPSTVSVDGDAGSIQPQNGELNPDDEDDDGMETPRASALVLSGDATPTADNPQAPSVAKSDASEIPPVPPLPTSLNIPGMFPNDSEKSLDSVDRPSTAPGPSQQSSVKANHEPIAPLNRKKTRSSNSLVLTSEMRADAGLADLLSNHDFSGPDVSVSREHLRKLLDGFLSPEDSPLANGNHPTTTKPNGKTPRGKVQIGPSRRHVSGGGIGRPPY